VGLGSRSGIPHLTPALSAPWGGEGVAPRLCIRLRKRTRIARKLRRDTTEVEKQLWRALRELESPYRFRRQHPIGRHVVDFACPGLKLAIELDGGQHATQEQADTARTSDISRYGYRVIRFWNGDVVNNLSGVLELIRRELEAERAGDTLSALQGGEGGAHREAMGG
jgi:very-short-patch-repair endonuclease